MKIESLLLGEKNGSMWSATREVNGPLCGQKNTGSPSTKAMGSSPIYSGVSISQLPKKSKTKLVYGPPATRLIIALNVSSGGAPFAIHAYTQ